MRTFVRVPALLGLFALCAAPTDCNSFQSTTVDVNQTAPPTIINGFYGPNGLSSIGADSRYRITDVNAAYVPYGAAIMYPGGVRRISVSWALQMHCTNGSVGLWIEPLDSVQSEDQTGAQGDPVSDGIYLVQGFRVSAHTCPAGYSPTYIGMSWDTVGENFHGTTSQHHFEMYWQP